MAERSQLTRRANIVWRWLRCLQAFQQQRNELQDLAACE
jgi:hypothetical protein